MVEYITQMLYRTGQIGTPVERWLDEARNQTLDTANVALSALRMRTKGNRNALGYRIIKRETVVRETVVVSE